MGSLICSKHGELFVCCGWYCLSMRVCVLYVCATKACAKFHPCIAGGALLCPRRRLTSCHTCIRGHVKKGGGVEGQCQESSSATVHVKLLVYVRVLCVRNNPHERATCLNDADGVLVCSYNGGARDLITRTHPERCGGGVVRLQRVGHLRSCMWSFLCVSSFFVFHVCVYPVAPNVSVRSLWMNKEKISTHNCGWCAERSTRDLANSAFFGLVEYPRNIPGADKNLPINHAGKNHSKTAMLRVIFFVVW